MLYNVVVWMIFREISAWECAIDTPDSALICAEQCSGLWRLLCEYNVFQGYLLLES